MYEDTVLTEQAWNTPWDAGDDTEWALSHPFKLDQIGYVV